MSDDRLITDRLNVGRPWTQAPGLPGHPNSRCIGMASAHVFSAKTGLNLSSVATGTDTVSTVTGLGPVSGTFDVVINAPSNSSVHVPDLPVISGTFSGNVDLSLAVLHRVPLGTIAGSFTITQMADPATGTLIQIPPV